ncbi:LytR/AlgR family response regulator transcription factor [Sabulibacter ruber]|uniref:LytR/AlgR family response regulator transcription factor n=1 Tax=Sabulibacter ruber TaxID=2811901 RepID=UPI001A978BCA|nr:LytTR family DNA-binding domain-containing protein [Sabulibacter ruber]
MTKIRTIVVDDEPLAREGLALLLESDPEIEVVATCGHGAEALEKISLLRPDLLFLDIQMPGMTGLEVASRLSAGQMPVIVFVTAYDQYALQAFEANAVDYLLKPFDDERFFRTLSKAKRFVQRNPSAEQLQLQLTQMLQQLAPPTPPRYLQRILVKEAQGQVVLKVSDIDWLQAEDYYVAIHLGRKKYLHREPLQQLETQLDPRQFVRIHRSTIVNIDRIQSLQTYFNQEAVAVLQDGTQLKVSRSRREPLQQQLES